MTSITAADINTLSAVQTVSTFTYLPFIAAFYLIGAAFPSLPFLEDGCLCSNGEMSCLLWLALRLVLARTVFGVHNHKRKQLPFSIHLLLEDSSLSIKGSRLQLLPLPQKYPFESVFFLTAAIFSVKAAACIPLLRSSRLQAATSVSTHCCD